MCHPTRLTKGPAVICVIPAKAGIQAYEYSEARNVSLQFIYFCGAIYSEKLAKMHESADSPALGPKRPSKSIFPPSWYLKSDTTLKIYSHTDWHTKT